MISLSTVEKPSLCFILTLRAVISCFTWVIWKNSRWSWTTTRAYHHQPAIELVIHLGSRSKALMGRDVVKVCRKSRGLSSVLSQRKSQAKTPFHLHWILDDFGMTWGSFQGIPLLCNHDATLEKMRGNHLWLKCSEACRWWGSHMPTQWERYGSDKDEWGRGERGKTLSTWSISRVPKLSELRFDHFCRLCFFSMICEGKTTYQKDL